MTRRRTRSWVVVLGILGVAAVIIVLFWMSVRTGRIQTEASTSDQSDQMISRGGIITEYDTETDTLRFIQGESNEEVSVTVDETTVIRLATNGEFVDAALDALQAGRLVSIVLDAGESDTAVGAIDVVEVQ